MPIQLVLVAIRCQCQNRFGLLGSSRQRSVGGSRARGWRSEGSEQMRVCCWPFRRGTQSSPRPPPQEESAQHIDGEEPCFASPPPQQQLLKVVFLLHAAATNVPPSLDSGFSATTLPIGSRPVPASTNLSSYTQTYPLVMSTSDGGVAHESLPAEEEHHGVQEATPIVRGLMVTIEGEISEAVSRDNSPQGTAIAAPLQTDVREPLLSSDSGSTPDQHKKMGLTHGVPVSRRYSMEDFIVSEQASLKSWSQLSMRSGSRANSSDQGGAKASSGSSCDKARSGSNPAQGSAKASSGSNRDEQCASVSSGSPGRDSWARLRPLNPPSWLPRRAFMMPQLGVQPWADRHSPTSYLNRVHHIEQQGAAWSGGPSMRPHSGAAWPAPLPFTPHAGPPWPDLVLIDDSVGAAAADDLYEQFARPAAGPV
ncbi:hypothetical protein HaLaN_02293 [Haematococcus lacustris]|uniref:Uncharacterized protein n=1 Tax=Haematococcus lacustris TaxID=44745 RepID=A0A699YKJ0_HAELA|nr:hypothetical protein HaLaN_02293 [Haematococcus lacustris]